MTDEHITMTQGGEICVCSWAVRCNGECVLACVNEGIDCGCSCGCTRPCPGCSNCDNGDDDVEKEDD